MAAFEAARFNHSRTSPHQRQTNCRFSAAVFDGRKEHSGASSLANGQCFEVPSRDENHRTRGCVVRGLSANHSCDDDNSPRSRKARDLGHPEETLAKKDVGYIPQGFGHSIENAGKEKGRILIVLNNGHYQTIDLSQWIAGNPTDVLATNFSQDASCFKKFRARTCF
jgi:hypothetical protein